MAKAFKISNDAAKAMADAFAAVVDGGSNAIIEIYEGTPPADVDTAITDQTLLATLTMSSTAFGAAVDDNPGAKITANAISPDSSADASGTASFYRILTESAGNAVAQGTVGTSDADLIMSTNVITSGSTVSISSFTITMSEG